MLVAIDGGAIQRSRSSLIDRRQFGILKGHIARIMRETKAALNVGAIDCDPYAGACVSCSVYSPGSSGAKSTSSMVERIIGASLCVTAGAQPG